MLLAHYYLAHNSDGKSEETGEVKAVNRGELFDLIHPKMLKESEKPDATKEFNNFLSLGAVKSSELFLKYLYPIMATRNYWANSPAHVQKLIETAFGFHPSPPNKKQLQQSSVEEVIKNLSQDEEGFAVRLGRNYADIWDVVRYSAHGGEYTPASGNPRVMRAAMQIFEAESEEDRPRFLIHYRAGDEDAPIRRSRGSILSLGGGAHMQFVGWEDPVRYPLNIVAKQSKDPDHRPSTFYGLVTRFHELGFFFASRVLFIRSKVKKIEDMDGRIKMHGLNELKQQLAEEHGRKFDKPFKNIENRVGSEAKSGLQLVI